MTGIVGIYPNPSAGRMNIHYRLSVHSQVLVAVYDLNDRLIRILDYAIKKAGNYLVHWNGNDDLGYDLSPGIYLIRIKINGCKKCEKTVFLI